MSSLKKAARTTQGRGVSILILMLVIVGIFEFLPAVDHARAMLPANFDESHNCQSVLRQRPWYGQVNPWLWFWLLSTPVMVFAVLPSAPAWQRAGRVLFAIALSHLVVNLGAHSAMEIRNAPFHGGGFKFRCYDIRDGAKFSSALFYAWVYGVIYTGWWLIVWRQYHKRKTRLIGENFKEDWVSKIVIFSSVSIPIFIVIWSIWRLATI